MSYCNVAVVGGVAAGDLPAAGALVSETRDVAGQSLRVNLFGVEEWYSLLALDGLVGLHLLALGEAWVREVNPDFLQQFGCFAVSFVFSGKQEKLSVRPAGLDGYRVDGLRELLEVVFVKLKGAAPELPGLDLAPAEELLAAFAQHPVQHLRLEHARTRSEVLELTERLSRERSEKQSLKREMTRRSTVFANPKLPANLGELLQLPVLTDSRVVAVFRNGVFKGRFQAQELAGRAAFYAPAFVLHCHYLRGEPDPASATLLILEGRIRVAGSLPKNWSDPVAQIVPRSVAEGVLRVLPSSAGSFLNGKFTGLGKLVFRNGFAKGMIKSNRLLRAEMNFDMPLKVGQRVFVIGEFGEEDVAVTTEGVRVRLDYAEGLLSILEGV